MARAHVGRDHVFHRDPDRLEERDFLRTAALGGLDPHVGPTVVVVAQVYLPRPTAHLTVLHIGLNRSAGGIDTDGYDFAAVGTAHLELRVPGLDVGGLERRVRIF